MGDIYYIMLQTKQEPIGVGSKEAPASLSVWLPDEGITLCLLRRERHLLGYYKAMWYFLGDSLRLYNTLYGKIKSRRRIRSIVFTANPYFAMQLVNRRCFAMLQIGLVRILPCSPIR
jgi:hypothetical protein